MKINKGPREKIKEFGISTLTDEELIAILIKTGNKEEDVLTLSKKILDEISNIQLLNDYTLNELMTFNGIGEVKAMTLIAAIELGNRIRKSKCSIKRVYQPKDIYEYIKNDYINLAFEKVIVIYMDNQLRILSKQVHSIGEYNRSYVDIKEIIKRSLKINASFICLVHNHPSGYEMISKEDKNVSKELELKLNEFNIELFDSIIVLDDKYISLKYSLFK